MPAACHSRFQVVDRRVLRFVVHHGTAAASHEWGVLRRGLAAWVRIARRLRSETGRRLMEQLARMGWRAPFPARPDEARMRLHAEGQLEYQMVYPSAVHNERTARGRFSGGQEH